jgi:hypothetical protein
MWVRRSTWIAALTVTACLVALVAACTTSGPAYEGDPLARLESLGAAWFETPATVTYSTLEHEAGSATSVHQCLRQVVETSVETAIRMCNPKGELTLTWDPPDRWLMEVSNDRGSSTLLSTPDGAFQCHQPVDEARVCAPTSATELASEAPFGSILHPPSQVLDVLGPGAAEALTARPGRQIAGMPAECFSAILPGADDEASRANWCYSKDGILLRSSVVLPDTGATLLEATEVSRSVSGAAFDDGQTVEGEDSDLASIAGTWEFEALTGVPPAELPPGSIPDNRHDLLIEDDGSFRWGSWSGHVEATGAGFALYVERPDRLGQRFIDYGTSAGITIDGDEMRIWLPDLGRDRDVDIGAAVEDIDSPDMAFRRASP